MADLARRPVVAVVAVLALAFVVAAIVKRAAPDFAALPVVAVVTDAAQRPLWAIRLARDAHEIAADAINLAPLPAGRAYQLWLSTPTGARSLGLLPVSGRKVIPEIPLLVDRLAGGGRLLASLEPARGSDRPRPSGEIVYRATLAEAHAPVAWPK